MTWAQDNAVSVRGLVLRATRLAADGTPVQGSADGADVYVTTGFIRLAFTPNYSTGDEIEIKNAAGGVCAYYKQPDTLKDTTVTLELCDPDPVLTQMLVGGVVLSTLDACLPSGATPAIDYEPAAGWAIEKAGVDATPTGVGLEVWAQAVVGGKPAAVCPYWRYVFPYVSGMKPTGEREVGNSALATVFEGRSLGNLGFGTGPDMMLETGDDELYKWAYPAYTDRSFLYARDPNAPLGLLGPYVNGPAKSAAAPGDVFPPEPTVTASDSTNAAKLAGLGYVANPLTAWTVGQKITIGTYDFNWSGSAWAAGAHA